MDNLLLSWKTTKKFIKQHPLKFFIRADKGNVTIAMNINVYCNKMNVLLLRLSSTYVKVNKIRRQPKTSTNEKNNEYVVRTCSDSEYRFLLSTDGILPRAYGLPKIHKQEYPFRIIVSSVNSIFYKKSMFFLHNIIQYIAIYNCLQVIFKIAFNLRINDEVSIWIQITIWFPWMPSLYLLTYQWI